jgi:hypothetical protein
VACHQHETSQTQQHVVSVVHNALVEAAAAAAAALS